MCRQTGWTGGQAGKQNRQTWKIRQIDRWTDGWMDEQTCTDGETHTVDMTCMGVDKQSLGWLTQERDRLLGCQKDT